MRTNDEIWEEIRNMQQWMNVYSHASDVLSDDMKTIKELFNRLYSLIKDN